MSDILRFAVIGVGGMGSNHARVLADMEKVKLVAVADLDSERAERIARRYNIPAYSDAQTLFEQEELDVVNICVPTVHHHATALQAIEQKLHVLVEKPIALSIEQGNEIVSAAYQAGVILTVGHVERFNPAVVELRQRVARRELGHIFQVDARRASPFPAHVRDVGVAIDLAVHDLDVMRYITGSEVKRVYAETAQRVHATHEDQLVSVLRFADGTIGKLMVNWLTPTKLRELTVVGERGMFVVNYLTQDLSFYENAAFESTSWEAIGVLRGVKEGPITRCVISKKEPLLAELEAFVEAIGNGSRPIVTGEDGVKALALAEQIIKAGLEHRIIEND